MWKEHLCQTQTPPPASLWVRPSYGFGAQRVERDGEIRPFFGGAIGIFGHGNVAGIGQALLQYRKDFRLYQARNEQGMVHMATGYAKMRNRLGALACSTSIGPGATNMVTGADRDREPTPRAVSAQRHLCQPPYRSGAAAG